jgi:hypothetical protein
MRHHMMRRLIPRQPADWRATYLIEGDERERGRDGRVIDISSLGAGLELSGQLRTRSPVASSSWPSTGELP